MTDDMRKDQMTTIILLSLIIYKCQNQFNSCKTLISIFRMEDHLYFDFRFRKSIKLYIFSIQEAEEVEITS